MLLTVISIWICIWSWVWIWNLEPVIGASQKSDLTTPNFQSKLGQVPCKNLHLNLKTFHTFSTFCLVFTSNIKNTHKKMESRVCSGECRYQIIWYLIYIVIWGRKLHPLFHNLTCLNSESQPISQQILADKVKVIPPRKAGMWWGSRGRGEVREWVGTLVSGHSLETQVYR